MSQNNNTFNLLVSILFLTFCVSMAGCATLATDQFIHHPRSELNDEFKPTNKQLAGVYSGLEIVKGQNYARIEILPNSEDCRERPVIELLLPMENNLDSKATYHFGKPIKEIKEINSLREKDTAHPVNIILYSPQGDMKKNVEEGMKLELSSYEWQDYPSTVIVGYKSNYADTFAYKIASGSEGFVVRSLDTKSAYHNRWMCKNKENNVAGILIKPFAIVLDIATSPLQFLSAVVIVSIYGF